MNTQSKTTKTKTTQKTRTKNAVNCAKKPQKRQNGGNDGKRKKSHQSADSKKGTIPKSGEETLDAFVDVSTGGMLCDYIFLHTDDRSNPCIQAVSV